LHAIGRGFGSKVRVALLAACAGLTWYGPAVQARTLYWSALDVAARLDADGRLHVTERHAMVFDGDWNGGERRFRVGGTQRLQLIAVRRIDGATAVPLRRGDLDRVDGYAFTDRNTLRWRSRLPSDPPFQTETLVYELEYMLSNVLLPSGTGYLLDHDFAFPDRDGVIESFSLELDLDSSWGPASGVGLPLSMRRSNLPPGASAVVTLPLQYRAAGVPTAVRRPTEALWLLPPLLGLLAFAGWRLQRYLAHERRNGRFVPLTPITQIDEAWLAANVFKYPPEKVGSLWDSTTGAAEVAAVLARLVQERKLTSRIEKRRRLMSSEDVLHLAIPDPRPDFNAYESALIKALFIDGDTTDTVRIREHYTKRGRAFDPAGVIRRYLPAKDPLDADNIGAIAGGWKLTWLLGLAALVMLGAGVATEVRFGITEAFVLQSFLLGLASVLFGIVLVMLGYALRGNVATPRRHLTWILVVYGLYVAVLVLIARSGNAYLGWSMYFALVALAACVLNLTLNRALTRTRPERIAQRKNLCAARAYLAAQLARPKPKLSDAWYPYLIAFGLDKPMDRWFGRFGPATPTTGTTGATGGPGPSTSAGGAQPAWTGGGGAFGGAGASGAWSTAAGAMAAGVATASSSSGGGGGGGGGSSGGGGGGGW
jgi:uncharacterized membrane protein YgcG